MLIAVLIAVGLWLIPGGMVKGFTVFGKIVVIVITVGLAAAIVETLTGLVLIPGFTLDCRIVSLSEIGYRQTPTLPFPRSVFQFALVRMPSSVISKTRLRLFSLRPMMK